MTVTNSPYKDYGSRPSSPSGSVEDNRSPRDSHKTSASTISSVYVDIIDLFVSNPEEDSDLHSSTAEDIDILALRGTLKIVGSEPSESLYLNPRFKKDISTPDDISNINKIARGQFKTVYRIDIFGGQKSERNNNPDGSYYMSHLSNIALYVFKYVFYVFKFGVLEDEKSGRNGNEKSKSYIISSSLGSMNSRMVDQSLELEKEIVQILSHEVPEVQKMGILPTYGYFEQHGHIFLVSKYCNRGKLSDQYAHMKASERLQSIRDLWEGVMNLHKLGIVHRDIKSSNMLVHYSEAKRVFKSYVADFGLSSCPDRDNKLLCTNTYITQTDLLKGFKAKLFDVSISQKSQLDDPKVDTWAFGLMICQLTDGHNPDDFNKITELYPWVTWNRKVCSRETDIPPVNERQSIIDMFIEQQTSQSTIQNITDVAKRLMAPCVDIPGDEQVARLLTTMAPI